MFINLLSSTRCFLFFVSSLVLLFSPRKSKEGDYNYGPGPECEAAAGSGLPCLGVYCASEEPHPGGTLSLGLGRFRLFISRSCKMPGHCQAPPVLVVGVANACSRVLNAQLRGHRWTWAWHAHPFLVTSWGSTLLGPASFRDWQGHHHSPHPEMRGHAGPLM